MAVQRYVVPDIGDDRQGWDLCTKYVGALVQSGRFAISNIVLFVASKHQLTGGDLPGFIGTKAAKTLDRNGVVKIFGLDMRAATLKTLSHVQRDTLILAFWADKEMMDKVDALTNVAAVVAYPWPEDGLDSWIATWEPIVHGRKDAKPAPLISDRIVEVALNQMTRMQNLSHQGLHSHYKDSAERTLRILRAQKHTLDAQNIRLWAVRNGWHPNMADDLQKMAAKIAALKTKPSLNSIYNGNVTYADWQKEAGMSSADTE